MIIVKVMDMAEFSTGSIKKAIINKVAIEDLCLILPTMTLLFKLIIAVFNF